MTSRWVVAFATTLTGPAAPPGVSGREFAIANLEDVHDLLHGLELVRAAVACPPELADEVGSVTWPGTTVVAATSVSAAWDRLAEHRADQVVVVAADAPDFPALLVGKLFRGLGKADIVVSPCEQGGLVALGVAVPTASWLDDLRVSLDQTDMADRLARAAPSPRAVSVTPGWHRLRDRADLALLDAGLEGWENTRMLLEGAAR
jgi:2-phospho-L-lactate guanylyltransferase (CobY/MobA/RfbA family)